MGQTRKSLQDEVSIFPGPLEDSSVLPPGCPQSLSHCTPPACCPGTLLTVHVQFNGGLLATGNGLIHAPAGEDTPDVQVRGVNEQLADGGLSLPILQQFLGWGKEGRHGQPKRPLFCCQGDLTELGLHWRETLT